MRVVTILGTEENAAKGKQAVEGKVELATRGHVQQPQMMQPVGVVEEMTVNDKQAGLVIGRGGEQIKSWQMQTGCRIQVSQRGDGVPNERRVTINALDPQAVKWCIALISQKVGLPMDEEMTALACQQPVQAADMGGYSAQYGMQQMQQMQQMQMQQMQQMQQMGMYGYGQYAGYAGYGQSPGYGQQATAAAPVVDPSGWQTVTDPTSGNQYYYNPTTGVSVWEKPAEMK
eukprot:TRINITY_DN1830_c0_g2_i1.p1 TRINITY_DN1830_c0_g2~~TRINITY_DN1830_c0_g2_i1.p1  ORF type:complete len:230 (+),score=58.67 TRINITY_DN1830_c0_g2_i1:125-814(+)